VNVETNTQTNDDSIGRFLYRILCGFFLGLSVFAPGISGSVIAIIMGVYYDLLDILSNPLKQLKRNILYIVPLAVGVVLSAGAFVIVFRFLFATYEKATYFFLVGLIIGSVPVIYREVKKYGLKFTGTIALMLSFAATFALSMLMGGGSSAELASGNITLSIPSMIYGGFATGASLLIPGLSASVILVLLGVYQDILFAAEALMRGDLSQLLPFGIFMLCVAGALVLTSRLIKTAFERIPRLAYAVVLGFMLGSLFGIAGNSLQIVDDSFNWWIGALVLTLGTALSLFFVYMSARQEEKKKEAKSAQS